MFLTKNIRRIQIMIKIKATNECEVVVTPEKVWFGERSPEREYQYCKEIENSIKRHVDGVKHTWINQKHVYEADGYEFDTLFEALEYLYWDDTYEYYTYRFKRPSDNGVGTRGTVYSFRELIEKAYKNPWDFTVLEAEPELSERQKEFLKNVIEGGLQDKA
jgi:hypothetical protein